MTGGAALTVDKGGLKYFGHLELPPGDYSLRTLVRNGAIGAFGKRTVILSVPRFGDQAAVLLPPLFPEAGGRWAVVHEAPRGEQKDVAYPFTVGAHAYVPASSPALQPGQDAAVALVGYHLGEDVQPEGKLEAADGRDLGACAIRVRGRVAGGDASPDVFQASFRPPVGLAPGSYRLVVTVDDGNGAPPRAVAAPFSVVALGAAPPP